MFDSLYIISILYLIKPSYLYQVESRSTVTDRYIKLYFTASISDRFNIWVEMNNARIVEAFAV